MEWKLFQRELGGLRERQNEITGSWNHFCKPLGAAHTVREKTRWPRAGTCHGAVGVPTGLGVRGDFETFQLISWLCWRQWEYCHCFRWSTLILLHNVEQLNLNLKYLNIRYSIRKSVPSFKTGGEAEQDMEKQNEKVRVRGRSCSEDSFELMVSFSSGRNFLFAKTQTKTFRKLQHLGTPCLHFRSYTKPGG